MNSSPTVIALHKRQNRLDGTEIGSRSLSAGKTTRPTMKTKNTAASDPKPPATLQLGHAPPTVQGISLVSRNKLSDRLRTIFPFPLFNAVQSKCFQIAFDSDENIVLSAPTGSGKTVVMELAICRLIRDTHGTDFKIVYQAPTKALCAERCQDWQTKFAPLDLQCAELTGDTDAGQIRKAQAADIIVTTPEKWDSITRRWKDHAKLMQMIKLFLIDEVHILKESRGATLEAVVSRMKSTGSSVRFIALSATVPNSEDVATWLGRDSAHPNLPAHCQKFGEEFRPVQLKKFVYGYPVRSNNFVLDSILESKSVLLCALPRQVLNCLADSQKSSLNIRIESPSSFFVPSGNLVPKQQRVLHSCGCQRCPLTVYGQALNGFQVLQTTNCVVSLHMTYIQFQIADLPRANPGWRGLSSCGPRRGRSPNY